MTEGTGHVIDPAGDARRALQEAVTAHGPEALSDATVMDNLCRTQLTALPGECILIVSAARADVPALLRDNDPATRQLRRHPVRGHHPGRGARPGQRREPVGGARVRPRPRPDRAGRNPVDTAPRAGRDGHRSSRGRRGDRGSRGRCRGHGRDRRRRGCRERWRHRRRAGGGAGDGGRSAARDGGRSAAGDGGRSAAGDGGRSAAGDGRRPAGMAGAEDRRRGGRPGPSCSPATRWG